MFYSLKLERLIEVLISNITHKSLARIDQNPFNSIANHILKTNGKRIYLNQFRMKKC